MSTDNRRQQILKGIRLYSGKEYEGLSPEQREKHLNNVFDKILQNCPDGITAPEITSVISYFKSPKSVQRYLEKLVNTNIAYKKNVGKAQLYYHNGRLLHEVLQENVPIGKKSYSFILMKNPEGEFVAIQESKKNDFGALTISGGIIVDKGNFPAFLEHIKSINSELIGGK